MWWLRRRRPQWRRWRRRRWRVEEGRSKFTWKDHWYLVSYVEDLDSNLLTPLQLLGKEIVLRKDPKSGDWVAFDDKCPHRLAPLSGGLMKMAVFRVLIMGGLLMGKDHVQGYHRQQSRGRPEAHAVKSSRACPTRLSTLVSQGLLFVWQYEMEREKALSSKRPI